MAGFMDVHERGLQLVGGAFSTRHLHKIGNFASGLWEDAESGSDEEEPDAVVSEVAFLGITYKSL
jgi:hypothetical protein